jgi:hypothetical protein
MQASLEVPWEEEREGGRPLESAVGFSSCGEKGLREHLKASPLSAIKGNCYLQYKHGHALSSYAGALIHGCKIKKQNNHATAVGPSECAGLTA